jgi:hypothetical protein
MTATSRGASAPICSRPQRGDQAVTALVGGGQAAGASLASLGVDRIGLGPGDWVLALLPGGLPRPGPARRAVRQAARELMTSSQSGIPGRIGGGLAIVRVPSGAIDPRLGLAVLRRSAAGTVIYCPARQIAADAARTVTAFAGRSHQMTGPPAGGAPGRLVVHMGRVDHERLPAALHPAVAVARGQDLTVWVCADLVTADVAGTFNALCAAVAR